MYTLARSQRVLYCQKDLQSMVTPSLMSAEVTASCIIRGISTF